MQNAVLEVLIPKWMLPKKSFWKVRWRVFQPIGCLFAVFKDEEGVYHECYRPLHPEKDNTMSGANVIPGTHLTPDLFADVASDVYQLHTPVYRVNEFAISLTSLPLVTTPYPMPLR